jgi:hypothetical protein
MDEGISLMDDDADDAELTDIMEYLIEAGYLTAEQTAVAQQIVVDDGTWSLSAAQERTLESIEQAHFPGNCGRCHAPIPLCEVIDALETGNTWCGYCDHLMRKDD